MSPSSSQQWSRRIRYGDQHIRVSDAERNAVAERLGQHYADGRLDQAEFDDRVARTMAAKTRGDLAGLFDDLPDLDAGPEDSVPGHGGPVGPSTPYRVRRRASSGVLRTAVLIVAVLIAANVTWHIASAMFIPWFWIAVVGLVVVLASRHRH